MATALIGGLCKSGSDPASIFVADPNQDQVATLVNSLNVVACKDNQALADACDVLVLAVKPQTIKTVVQALTIREGTLIVSIAAGIRCNSLQSWSTTECAIVRSMPNTPALVQCGAAGLFANQWVSDAQRQIAETIMSAVGMALWVDEEDQLDAVTAVSGSGPAYFFYMMEAIESAGVELGLTPQTSRALTLQTALGAAKLAINSDEATAQLRAKVTSPGGTTEAAINHLQATHSLDNIKQAVTAAYNRSQTLAEQSASD